MTSEVPSSSLPYKLNQQNQAQYQHNIKLLEKIVDAIILCGKQNIPLRGHKDDTTSDSSNKGYFLAILQLLAKHDEQLWSHLQKAKKNALYTSKTIQNEVIQLIGNYITDTREHPAIIKEEFLDFANIGRTSGETIADKLIEILRLLAIPIENMRGQAYDGAAAMASEKRGCQGRIKSLNQLAFSPKRQGFLETIIENDGSVDFSRKKLVGLCKTRKRDIAIFTASKLIEEHVDRIKEIRRAVDTELESCFEDAKQIAGDLDIVIKTPRVCSKQQHGENVSTSNPRDYYRSVVAIPFLDFFLSELNTRFQKEDLGAYSICSLLPANVTTISHEELSKLASELICWGSDLPCLSVKDLEKELRDWRRYCVNMSKETSDKLYNLLNLFNFVDGDVFPKVKIILHIGCVLPITTCEAERSFSGLRRIKSYMRSTMQEDRLTGLALMHLHHSLEIDQKEIVQSFFRQGKRRLFQSSLFS
ncbi:52 kDa repressor of the inhibitor of the protein kinase-like [Ostrea edulis]|uniref:52 kDa repressor of the inhibitor of the protein kinase-like n=1 Tax=Ostrea edulis TaxID=37623 RepID=UPI0024AEA087|nr:52 kDa repressor of the inhibitor of the protein kinase-like [Ostrea edulis]